MARNRIIYGSQSVWCNGEVLYRVQTLGSTTTFTSEDIFELGHLDIIDVVDDVPAVAVTLNTNDWGDVRTMAILTQVASDKLEMDTSATDNNANLEVLDSGDVNVDYLHGVCITDFAVQCGNLTGVSMWAPVQSECDLGTLTANVDQTLFMDEVYINSLEFGYTTGANATENYGAETDQKIWLLNDGRFVNWESFDYATITGSMTTHSGGIVLGATATTLSDGNPGFLRHDANGYRAVTVYDAGTNEMTNYRVSAGSSPNASYFVFHAASDTLYLPTALSGSIASGDYIYALYAADEYAAAATSTYFAALNDSDRPGVIGALRQGQVEIYIVADTDASFENAWRLTGCTITSDLTREPLAELGHLGPYDRPLTLPVPITVTIDTTAGDLTHWAKFAGVDFDTVDDIDLADLMAEDELKLVVKVFAQTDEEAGGTGSSRTVLTGSELVGETYMDDGVPGTYSAGNTERALKTIVVEHLKITDEAYTLDMGTNATQTFGFRSTNDLYVVKGDISISQITSGNKIRRNS